MKRLVIILIVLTMLNSAYVQQQGPIDMVSEFEEYYDFEAIVLVDTLLFFADGYGLSVYSYNEDNPEHQPQRITQYMTPGMTEALCVVDTICYLADSYNGLLILSIVDINRIYEIGHCADATFGEFIIVEDAIAYIACNELGLRTVDVSNPFEPVLLNTYNQCRSQDIRLVDDQLYSVTDNRQDLFIFDISNPSDIQLRSQYQFDHHPEGIEIHDNFLYTLINETFTVVSIADPDDLEIIYESNPSFGMGFIMNAIRYFDGFIYMGRVGIWDVHNPYEPVNLIHGAGYGARYVEIGDDISYICSSSGYYIYDIENREDVERLHWVLPALGLSDVFIQDSYLYVSSRFKYGSKFDIYDIEDIHNPMKIGEIDSTVGNDYRVGYDDIYVQGDIAVLSEWKATNDSLYIFSIEDIEHPREVSRMGVHSVEDLEIDGDYLYIGCERPAEGLKVISIEDPTNPRIVWESDAAELCAYEVYGVALSDNHAYSVSRSLGGVLEENFRIWDRSDPDDLQLVGSCVVEGFEATIAVSGEYAYVTGVIDRGLLSVVSIADPENPELVFTIRLPDYGRDCIVSDGYLYISYSNLGFEIFDLEDPERPELIAHYDTPITIYYYNQLAVVDGYVITPGIIYDCARVTGRWNVELSAESYDFGVLHLNSDSTFQLTIINLARQNVEILDISCDSIAFTVDFDEAFIIAAGEDAEVNITFTPTEERQYNGQLTIHTERRDLSVSLSGTGVDLSVTEDELLPLEFKLYPAYPNPFNSLTRINYSLDQPGITSLKIFDITGREAAVLREGYMKSGDYSILWKGEDMPSGVYFCRLVSSGRERVAKVVLMR